MTKNFKLEEFGYEVEFGKVAQQAAGAAWFKSGKTVILSTVASSETKNFPGFLPLTVDYRELFSAAGKIPGGYYKREGKFSDKEVLTSRLIDRAIRPLFPADYFEQIQILNTVYSADVEDLPATLALISCSIALTVSDLPFLGPIGAIEAGRVDGKWIFSPTLQEYSKSDCRVIVAGTEEGICMVEGTLNEVSESDFLDLLFIAFKKIQPIIKWQKEIVKELGKEKNPIEDRFNLKIWNDRASEFLTEDVTKAIFKKDKVEREKAQSKLKEEFFGKYINDITEETPQSILDYAFNTILKEKITDLIFKLNKRVDGRDFDEIRNISIELGLLPATHGSSLFTRGRTQALSSVTLGSGQDVQRKEDLLGESEDSNFMLHYNFPPFAVGEVRPMRGPGRREVGHGYLAVSAIKGMLPDKAKFPYTIRIVADILESDGSSSMATVCGSTMALMDAGVPIKEMVGGVAMGLLKDPQSNNFVTLTDIAGFEDAFGLMDFKVAGTEKGITAIQMDIKYKGGLKKEVFEEALSQASAGRLFILNKMQKVMSKPRSELSASVPRVATVNISSDKIGAVIGSGGKIVKEIIEKTSTEIDIEDDGLIKIFGVPGEGLEKAIKWVKVLAGLIDVGAEYSGIVKRITDFGIFVEIAPGKDGLLHISKIPKKDQNNLSEVYKINSPIKVKVIGYDESTGRIGLAKVD